MKSVGVKLLHKDAKLPSYADPGASGFDFYAVNEIKIGPKCSGVANIGIAMEIPKGYEIQARGRSGLAFNSDVIAHFGTIDESFKGEIKVKLFNLGTKPIIIKPGDRVAQGVLAKKSVAKLYVTSTLSESERGEGGFGHSGK